MLEDVFCDWLIQLRSGRWRQCRHRLRDGDDGRSAFGCLIEAAIPYRGGGCWRDDPDLGWCWGYRRLVQGILDTERLYVTGVPQRQPLWPEWTFDNSIRVHGWSDRYQYSFEKIADLLEAGEYVF
jgi:hypothetical protein